MATFRIKKFNQIYGLDAQDGDIAYIENVDGNRHPGVAFRTATSWTKPLVILPERLANTVTTNTPQVITGAKNFVGEVRFASENIYFNTPFLKVSAGEFSYTADESVSSKATITSNELEFKATDGTATMYGPDSIEGNSGVEVFPNKVSIKTRGLGGSIDVNGIGSGSNKTEIKSAFASGSQTVITLDPIKVTMETLTVLLPDLQLAANNAGAISAGLSAGMLYRTATGEVRIVV